MFHMFYGLHNQFDTFALRPADNRMHHDKLILIKYTLVKLRIRYQTL